jgi:FkbM family methyltransferase
MTESITLTLVDGVRIVVPNSVNLLTPYVLAEQRDWFEDELRFLRRLLGPGQKAIDIGANYGVYTLSMAKAVGAEGFVWAFEPASSTAALLAQGVAANGFGHVILDRSALSSEPGTGCLTLNENSELNALTRAESAATASETVPLVTLDECLQRYGWRDIDFVKLDAEGEEANILKGGTQFFAELSPLLLYEVKTNEFHLELVRDFAALGLQSYRLVVGLNLLVPFSPDSTPDPYLLNLFCCNPSRAAQLVARGVLLAATQTNEDHYKTLMAGNDYTWRNTITRLPYGAQLATQWENATATEDSRAVGDALACYAISRDERLAPAERFNALEASFSSLQLICKQSPQHLRLASLARVAHDYGAQSVVVSALQQLAAVLMQNNTVDVSEPFLAPGERFDTISPGEQVGSWVLASVLEQLERRSYYSSFFAESAGLQRLELIGKLGFASPEMVRRLELVQTRLGGKQ